MANLEFSKKEVSGLPKFNPESVKEKKPDTVSLIKPVAAHTLYLYNEDSL